MVAAALSLFPPAAAVADEDSARLDRLTLEVETLTEEVANLRARVELLDAIRPTTTMLMPSVAERFHVMHYAGDAGDWALASHELLGIRHLMDVITRVDPEKGSVAKGFLAASLERIDAAIEHGDGEAFAAAIKQTVDSCNACHVAVGSPSMVVTLDVADALSLRHSHRLALSEKPGEHTHKH
jgi:tetrahydromethanopterin S-methyltransferase subunit B